MPRNLPPADAGARCPRPWSRQPPSDGPAHGRGRASPRPPGARLPARPRGAGAPPSGEAAPCTSGRALARRSFKHWVRCMSRSTCNPSSFNAICLQAGGEIEHPACTRSTPPGTLKLLKVSLEIHPCGSPRHPSRHGRRPALPLPVPETKKAPAGAEAVPAAKVRGEGLAADGDGHGRAGGRRICLALVRGSGAGGPQHELADHPGDDGAGASGDAGGVPETHQSGNHDERVGNGMCHVFHLAVCAPGGMPGSGPMLLQERGWRATGGKRPDAGQRRLHPPLRAMPAGASGASLDAGGRERGRTGGHHAGRPAEGRLEAVGGMSGPAPALTAGAGVWQSLWTPSCGPRRVWGIGIGAQGVEARRRPPRLSCGHVRP